MIMEMILQVHMTDQVMLPLPRHSFLELRCTGFAKEGPVPLLNMKFYVFTDRTHTHTHGFTQS